MPTLLDPSKLVKINKALDRLEQVHEMLRKCKVCGAEMAQAESEVVAAKDQLNSFKREFFPGM